MKGSKNVAAPHKKLEKRDVLIVLLLCAVYHYIVFCAMGRSSRCWQKIIHKRLNNSQQSIFCTRKESHNPSEYIALLMSGPPWDVTLREFLVFEFTWEKIYYIALSNISISTYFILILLMNILFHQKTCLKCLKK